jgi:hypothetical protein
MLSIARFVKLSYSKVRSIHHQNKHIKRKTTNNNHGIFRKQNIRLDLISAIKNEIFN